MKIILIILLIVLKSYSITLPWLHNLTKAKELAKKEKKDIYVFVGADKCRFCEMYKKEALDDTDVIKALKKKFVLVYLSRDQHKIPSNFQKFGVPLHYFLKSDGSIYFIDAGVKDKNGVFLMIDEADLHKEE